MVEGLHTNIPNIFDFSKLVIYGIIWCSQIIPNTIDFKKLVIYGIIWGPQTIPNMIGFKI